MASNIHKFLADRYSAFPLMLATERAIPGMLIETDWDVSIPIFWKETPEFRHEEGFTWDFLQLDENKYQSEIVEANIIQQSISERKSLGGDVSLPQYGISLGAALSSDFSGVFKVTGIKARVFKDTRSPYELIQALLKLKESNSSLWDWVNDDFLITESYYVTSFHAQFKSEKGLSAKAEFEKAGQKIEGKVKLNWINDSVLEMVGTPSVPIAVRGLKV
jgi:hypothetical protein